MASIQRSGKVNLTKGSSCFAFNCKNYRNKVTGSLGISFHKFPDKKRYPELYTVWVRNCKRNPTASSMLCSAHFDTTLIDRTGNNAKLKPGAVPTVFDLPDHLQTRKVPERQSVTSRNASQVSSPLATLPVIDSSESSTAVTSTAQQTHSEHSYYLSPGKAKKRILALQDQNLILEKKLRNCIEREKKAKRTCHSLVEKLKEQSMINAELEHQLLSYKDIPCDLFLKPCSSYSEAQRNFALTLHLYSPKAYKYLRDVVKLCLPEPRTLRKWLEKIDAEPGLNVAMIETLALKRESNPVEYTHCCLMIDAMAIKQQIEYDPQKQCFTGFVDLGSNEETDCEAKEALVIMLVGLRGRWKAPIGYYLTKGLSAEAQTQLVSHALEKVAEHGLQVNAMTMDGHPTNVSMCRLLGCRLTLDTSFQSSFNHKGAPNQTYVIFDACHMLKLVRNMLKSYQDILSRDGKVSQYYVELLHQVQEVSGLRLGNKLTQNHIDFAAQKMKVSLAAQTISASVADAISSLRLMGMRQFATSEPTELFLKRINRLFDLANSRSAFGIGTKQAVTIENWEEVNEFLEDTYQYLLELQTKEGIPLHRSPRGTCILGMSTLVRSIQGLTKELVLTSRFQYLLTYKTSQDHLELFFSAVRQAGGWSNNPTALQFKNIMRKLLGRAGCLSESVRANVTRLDETQLIQASTSSYVSITHKSETADRTEELDASADVPRINERNLSPVIGNIAVYIAGWVVRKVKSHLGCPECIEVLTQQPPSLKYKDLFTLLDVKNRGGLTIPSDDVVEVILYTEKLIRSLTLKDQAKQSYKLLKIETMTLQYFGSNKIFERLNVHMRVTSVGIDNHLHELIRLIVQSYYNLRCHEIVKRHNLKLQGSKIRSKYNKLILFKGQ